MKPFKLDESFFTICNRSLTNEDYTFFIEHISVFKRMCLEQGEGFWICFLTSFRSFIHKDIIVYDADSKTLHILDATYITLLGDITQKKPTAFVELLNNIITVAGHKEMVSFASLRSPSKNPFMLKKTRAAFRRLFGEPSNIGKVDLLLDKMKLQIPLYFNFATTICFFLRLWLHERKECTSKEFQWEPPPTWRDKDYQPKPFEIYLFHYWGDSLFSLVPVSRNSVMWWDRANQIEDMMQEKMKQVQTDQMISNLERAIGLFKPKFSLGVAQERSKIKKMLAKSRYKSNEAAASSGRELIPRSKLQADEYARMREKDPGFHPFATVEDLPCVLSKELWKANPLFCAKYTAWFFFRHFPPVIPEKAISQPQALWLLNEWEKQVWPQQYTFLGILISANVIIRKIEMTENKSRQKEHFEQLPTEAFNDFVCKYRILTNYVENKLELNCKDNSETLTDSLTSQSLMLKLPWNINLCNYWLDTMLTMVYELMEILAPLYYYPVPKRAFLLLKKFDEGVLKETHAVLMMACMRMELFSTLNICNQIEVNDAINEQAIRRDLERCFKFLFPRVKFLMEYQHLITNALINCLDSPSTSKKLQYATEDLVRNEETMKLEDCQDLEIVEELCTNFQMKTWELSFLASYRNFHSWIGKELNGTAYIRQLILAEKAVEAMKNELRKNVKLGVPVFIMPNAVCLRNIDDVITATKSIEDVFWTMAITEDFKDQLQITNTILREMVKEGYLNPLYWNRWLNRKHTSRSNWKKGVPTIAVGSKEEMPVFFLVQYIARLKSFEENFWASVENEDHKLNSSCLQGTWLKEKSSGSAPHRSPITKRNVYCDMLAAQFRHKRTEIIAKLDVTIQKMVGLPPVKMPPGYIDKVKNFVSRKANGKELKTYLDSEVMSVISKNCSSWSWQSLGTHYVLKQTPCTARDMMFPWRCIGSTVPFPEMTLTEVDSWLKNLKSHCISLLTNMYHEYFLRENDSESLEKFPYHQTLEDFFPQEIDAIKPLLVEGKFEQGEIAEQVKRQIHLLITRLKWLEEMYLTWKRKEHISQAIPHVSSKLQKLEGNNKWPMMCELEVRFIQVHLKLTSVFSTYLQAGGYETWPYSKETMEMIESFLEKYGRGFQAEEIANGIARQNYIFFPTKLFPTLQYAEKLCMDCIQEWGFTSYCRDWTIESDNHNIMPCHQQLIDNVDFIFTNYYFISSKDTMLGSRLLHKSAASKILKVCMWLQQELGAHKEKTLQSLDAVNLDVLEILLKEKLAQISYIVANLPKPSNAKLLTKLPKSIAFRNDGNWMESYKSFLKNMPTNGFENDEKVAQSQTESKQDQQISSARMKKKAMISIPKDSSAVNVTDNEENVNRKATSDETMVTTHDKKKKLVQKNDETNCLQTGVLRHCAFCRKEEPKPKSFKKCQRCQMENVRNKRYYCSKLCQVDDWKERHRDEHTKAEFDGETEKLESVD